jgi:hypothetical protein
MKKALHLHIPLAQFLTDAERIAEALPRAHKRAPKPQFERVIANELRKLVREIRRYDLTRPRPLTSVAKFASEAADMATSIAAAVRFALSVGKNDLLKARFERVQRENPTRSVSYSQLAFSCEMFAGLARAHATDLAELIPPDLVDRLDAKATELRDRDYDRRARLSSMSFHTSLRNARVKKLEARLREIRAAASFHLRADPELLREFATSRGRPRRQREGVGQRPRSASSVSEV